MLSSVDFTEICIVLALVWCAPPSNSQRILVFGWEYLRPLSQIVHEYDGVFVALTARSELDDMNSQPTKRSRNWNRWEKWVNRFSQLLGSTYHTGSWPFHNISSNSCVCVCLFVCVCVCVCVLWLHISTYWYNMCCSYRIMYMHIQNYVVCTSNCILVSIKV